MENSHNNIIALNAHRFPTQTDAIHIEYGHCRVIEVNGDYRKINYRKKNSDKLVILYEDVHISTLIPVILPEEIAE